jgi:hypothetical protein
MDRACKISICIAVQKVARRVFHEFPEDFHFHPLREIDTASPFHDLGLRDFLDIEIIEERRKNFKKRRLVGINDEANICRRLEVIYLKVFKQGIAAFIDIVDTPISLIQNEVLHDLKVTDLWLRSAA